MRDVNSIVVNGEAIGKVPGWYVYVPCVSCGKERWTLKTLTQRLKYTGLCHKCNLYAHSGENHPMWKGGRYIDNNGYVRVMIKGHPFGNKDGYVLEHRFVAVKEWSINAVMGMHVHHKNGDRTDNRIKNLELLSCREHTRLHKRTATSKQKLPEEPHPIIS